MDRQNAAILVEEVIKAASAHIINKAKDATADISSEVTSFAALVATSVQNGMISAH